MAKSISLILPIYNEPKIHKNIPIIDKELKNTGLPYEIIAINDGSDAVTTTRLNKISLPNLRTFVYAKNQGKGFALRYGFQQSKGDFVCFMDSDLQLHPRQIALFIDLLTVSDVDIIIGSKRHELSQVEYGPRRRLYSWGYQQLIRALFKLNITDSQVGLKLFKRHVLEAVMPRLIVKKWTCDLEILVVAYHLGFNKILEAPVKLNWKSGKSHINWKVIFNMLTDTVAIFYRKNVLRFYERELENHDLGSIPVLDGNGDQQALPARTQLRFPASGIIFTADQQ